MRYFADAGPARGVAHSDEVPDAVFVLEARGAPMPIGVAYLIGQTPRRQALWRLTIGGVEQGGLWLMIDREFVPAK